MASCLVAAQRGPEQPGQQRPSAATQVSRWVRSTWVSYQGLQAGQSASVQLFRPADGYEHEVDECGSENRVSDITYLRVVLV